MITSQTVESTENYGEMAAVGDTSTHQPLKKVSLRTAATDRVARNDRVWQARGRAVSWLGATGFSVGIETTAPIMRFSETNRSDSCLNAPFIGQMMVPHTATSSVDELSSAILSLRTAFAQARAQLSSGELSEEVREQFKSRVESLLWKFGQAAFDAATRIVLVEGAEPRLGLLALKAAGDINDGSVHETRLTLARNALQSRVPELRYGALHILADLGDRSALVDIREAAKREPIATLRSDMNRLSGLLSGALT